MKTIGLWLLFFGLLFACQSPARKETASTFQDMQAEVLDHFARHPADSLKLRAARFLLEHLPDHTFREVPNATAYQPALDSVAKYHRQGRRWVGLEHFNRIADSLQKINPRPSPPVTDEQRVTADFLIENVTLAFQAHRRLSEHYPYRLDFDAFCQYVLPYRSTNEPLEPNIRRQLYRQYGWFYHSLATAASLETAVDQLLDTLNLEIAARLHRPYGLPLSVSQVHTMRVGSCHDLVNYAVHVLRALGIPSGYDFTPHWGDHHRLGHSWLYLRTPDGWLAKDPVDQSRLNERYRNESLPKVYRYQFAASDDPLFAHTIDCTADYRPTYDVRVPYPLGQAPSLPVYVHVFDATQEWSVVDQATQRDSVGCTFRNLSLRVVYLAAYISRGKLQPVNYPFVLNHRGQVQFLIPTSHRVEATLSRKYPPRPPRVRHKHQWYESLAGVKLQAAQQTDFSDAITLHTLDPVANGLPRQFAVPANYAYYRLVAPDTAQVHLAACQLYDRQHQMIKADVAFTDTHWEYAERADLSDREVHPVKLKKVLDEDPLTFVAPDRGLTLTYRPENSQQVDHFLVQPRNDDNYIKPGDTYELFYWDKTWQSLGQQVADSYTLRYRVPTNAVCWLKNLSRGKEEHVFLVSKTGEQQWPSQFIPEDH